MVKKTAGKAAGAAGIVAKKAEKIAAQTTKLHVIDEVSKPVKKAATEKIAAITSGIKAKAEEKAQSVMKEQMKKELKRKFFKK